MCGAAALGTRLARRFRSNGARPEVAALATRLGVEIVIRDVPPPAQPRLRSEYQPEPPRIILYRAPIDSLAVAASADPRFEIERSELDELHVAHELYHHLERVGQAARMSLAETEKAAHAFARELLGLSFDPRDLSAVQH